MNGDHAPPFETDNLFVVVLVAWVLIIRFVVCTMVMGVTILVIFGRHCHIGGSCLWEFATHTQQIQVV